VMCPACTGVHFWAPYGGTQPPDRRWKLRKNAGVGKRLGRVKPGPDHVRLTESSDRSTRAGQPRGLNSLDLLTDR
jgi:hypothetical protein